MPHMANLPWLMMYTLTMISLNIVFSAVQFKKSMTLTNMNMDNNKTKYWKW